MQAIAVDMADLVALLHSATERPLNMDEHKKLKAAITTLGYLTQLVEQKNMSIQRLRKMLFGAKTEKIGNVIKTGSNAEPAASDPQEPSATVPGMQKPGAAEPVAKPEPKPGHGRNGADTYTGANHIRIGHPDLCAGALCPACEQGKVYDMPPKLLVRVTGQAPLQATVNEMQKLRCNLCGEIFTAPTPEGIGAQKYDERAASMISVLKYGSGMPFYRQQRLQENLGIPLPASTQWEIVESAARAIKPVYEELIRYAAQGDVIHNDDTTAKILTLMKENAQRDPSSADTRTGIFTSGIVSVTGQRQIALFFTGRQHAGENLSDVLAHRAAALGPPTQMCDALTRNQPESRFETILSNCNAHARRKYVEAAPQFPDECKFVLEILAQVYRTDGLCKLQGLSDPMRLLVHQIDSGPLMTQLHDWIEEQFAQRKVEPNSGLGQAISYMLNHWSKLTLFLRRAGVPLDNTVVERALKMAILHRKNAMFYRTQKGADVGDLFMTLIYTCQLCRANPFEYLTALLQHQTDLEHDGPKWMPWNYTEALQHADAA
jgi:transposase